MCVEDNVKRFAVGDSQAKIAASLTLFSDLKAEPLQDKTNYLFTILLPVLYLATKWNSCCSSMVTPPLLIN